ncbi:olfactory receptor 14A2-like [Tachyglossus aculeatus]|uniref:olfactory receptor 14A2-like n=1 Tax=Tachyglossus aculeatus TaxID=9261 RepID=UPI0018F56515|nr:olfactory receptor 14A2-like [Tachyglossus aculeatus]
MIIHSSGINVTVKTEFLLLEFLEARELQLVYAALYLLVYLAALTGKVLTIAVTTLDRCFHIFTYVFLRHLSFCGSFFMDFEYFVFMAMSYYRCATICLSLCHNVIMDRGSCGKMFFSDLTTLLMISCSEEHVAMDVGMTKGAALAVACIVPIVIWYIRIFWALFCDVLPLLKITCSEKHITIDATVHCIYMKLPSDSSLIVDPLVCVFYATMPLALKPLI